MLGEVYNQSICIMNAAVYMHYVEGKPMHQIAEALNLSKSTVSRLLKRAIDENVVRFEIEPNFLESIQLEETIQDTSGLQEVLVVPILSGKKQAHCIIHKKDGSSGRRTLYPTNYYR